MLTLCLRTLAWVLSDADLLCEWWCRDAGASRTQPTQEAEGGPLRGLRAAWDHLRGRCSRRGRLSEKIAQCALMHQTFDL